MNKLKQCTYTVILIITCLVMSPMIYKQIWKSSEEKKKKPETENVEIDIHAGENQQPAATPTDTATTAVTTTAPQVTMTDIVGSVITQSAATTTTAVTTVQTSPTFVQSDYSYFDDALFIGDSRTVGISEYGSLGNADFFCSTGLTSLQAYQSAQDGDLASMITSKHYGKIYIMLGINEVGNNFDTTFGNFKGLVDTVKAKSPDSLIFLEANLHVTFDSQSDIISNERINTLNGMIQSLADNQKIFYIDINPVFDDEYGNLRAECAGDGVHVYAKYYASWSDWFCLYTIQ